MPSSERRTIIVDTTSPNTYWVEEPLHVTPTSPVMDTQIPFPVIQGADHAPISEAESNTSSHSSSAAAEIPIAQVNRTVAMRRAPTSIMQAKWEPAPSSDISAVAKVYPVRRANLALTACSSRHHTFKCNATSSPKPGDYVYLGEGSVGTQSDQLEDVDEQVTEVEEVDVPRPSRSWWSWLRSIFC